MSSLQLHRGHRAFRSAEFRFFPSPCLPPWANLPFREKKNRASGTGASRVLLEWCCSELQVHWLFGVRGQRRALGPGIQGSARGGEREIKGRMAEGDLVSRDWGPRTLRVERVQHFFFFIVFTLTLGSAKFLSSALLITD